jgi:hypothetical protein
MWYIAVHDRGPDGTKLDVDAPPEVEVSATVPATSPRTIPDFGDPPVNDGVHLSLRLPNVVTYSYPEAVYDAAGMDKLRRAASNAVGEHLLIAIEEATEIDETLVETILHTAGQRGVKSVTVRVDRHG